MKHGTDLFQEWARGRTLRKKHRKHGYISVGALMFNMHFQSIPV